MPKVTVCGVCVGCVGCDDTLCLCVESVGQERLQAGVWCSQEGSCHFPQDTCTFGVSGSGGGSGGDVSILMSPEFLQSCSVEISCPMEGSISEIENKRKVYVDTFADLTKSVVTYYGL